MGSSDVEWGGVLERAGERLAWNLVLEATRAASDLFVTVSCRLTGLSFANGRDTHAKVWLRRLLSNGN